MVAPRSLLSSLAVVVSAVVACTLVEPVASGAVARPEAPRAAAERQIDLARWGVKGLRHGTFDHTRVRPGHGVVVGRSPDRVRYRDPYGSGRAVAYDRGRWYSGWHRPGFGFTELIASYSADTPVGTFIEVSVRGRSGGGRTSSFDSLGRWAAHDVGFHRMSLGAQADDLASVSVDTWQAKPAAGLAAWQLRVTLYRKAGTSKSPAVRMVGAMSSRLPAGAAVTSAPTGRRGVDLKVPRYSQQIHKGEYPQWNGGGEAWCSPTSTSMVVAFWGEGPTRRQYSWVKHQDRQPWVDYAARYTYASGYDGTGDWPFNTAYASRFGLSAHVTRLRSMREAEKYLRAGIPLVASIAFGPGELDGAPIGSTNGHLLVIRGVTDNGRVIVNDPAAAKASGVRRVYKRAQFERAWIGTTGGVVYVIKPAGR